MDKEVPFSIAVFDGTSEVILYLDLRFLNLRVFALGSQAFEEYIASFVGSSGTHFFEEWQYHSKSGYSANLYAFAPVDINKPVSSETFHNLKEAILLMYPSEYQLKGIAYYVREEDGKYTESYANEWNFVSHWYVKKSEEYEPDLLDFPAEEALAANPFIENYFNRKSSLSDFEVAIDSYVESFAQEDAKMAYINLCIALEAIVRAEGEITYRLSRTCAVISISKKRQLSLF